MHFIFGAILPQQKVSGLQQIPWSQPGPQRRCSCRNENQFMKTLAKTLLISSVVLFAVSLTGPGGEFLWGFLKPLSALMFVNYFIMNLLAKEYDRYDEEFERRMKLAGAKPSKAPIPATPRPTIRRPQLAH
jgi:hypothetical protein